MGVDEIDTSFWIAKDKEWKDARKKSWPAIEKVLSLNRRKSEVNVIKQYFLHGRMPKWEQYKNWNDLYRHLDVFLFLWLHPSSDIDVLIPLYKAYMESELTHERDVVVGYNSFLQNEFLMSTAPYKSLEEYPYPFLGAKNIILFKVLFSDTQYAKTQITQMGRGKYETEKSVFHIFHYLGYNHFIRIGSWLKQKWDLPMAENSLYKYNIVLDWILAETLENDEIFKECCTNPKKLSSYIAALNTIFRFDFEAEGDTPRAELVSRLLGVMDSFDFIPEFKTIWCDVKGGRRK